MRGGGDDGECRTVFEECVDRGAERSRGESVEGGGELVDEDRCVWFRGVEQARELEAGLLSGGECLRGEGPEVGLCEADLGEELKGLGEGGGEEVDDGFGWVGKREIIGGDGVGECVLERSEECGFAGAGWACDEGEFGV